MSEKLDLEWIEFCAKAHHANVFTAETVLALIARIRELEPDAQRYRALRHESACIPMSWSLPAGEKLDAAVDEIVKGA